MSLQVEEVKKRLAEKRIELTLTDAALQHALDEAYDPAFGARPLKRFLERHVVSELSIMILEGPSVRETLLFKTEACLWWGRRRICQTACCLCLSLRLLAGKLRSEQSVLCDWSAQEGRWEWRVSGVDGREVSRTKSRGLPTGSRTDYERLRIDGSRDRDFDADASEEGPMAQDGLLPRSISQSSRSSSYTGRSEAMHSANAKRFRF